jgi:hypothetical protein
MCNKALVEGGQAACKQAADPMRMLAASLSTVTTGKRERTEVEPMGMMPRGGADLAQRRTLAGEETRRLRVAGVSWCRKSWCRKSWCRKFAAAVKQGEDHYRCSRECAFAPCKVGSSQPSVKVLQSFRGP